MTDSIDSNRSKFTIGAALAILAIAVALLFTSAAPAHAIYQPFCWNVTLSNNQGCDEYTHDHFIPPYITEVGGTGFQHSVCVRVRATGVTQCSSGPAQGVYNFTPDGTYGPNADYGIIIDNAPGSNTVQAFVDYCNNPC
jgi:hypothetical protein